MDWHGKNRRVWSSAVGAVSVFIVVALVWVGMQREAARRAEEARLHEIEANATRFPVPENTKVPPRGAAGLPENVAVPSVVASANVAGTSDLRSFSLRASGNTFSPNTIIVKVNDVVKIAITAVDRDYDFTQPDYGIKETIPSGQTKTIAFASAAEGKFVFYCSSCGGTPETRPKGWIVVVRR